MKEHLMAAGCTAEQAEMLSGMSAEHADHMAGMDPTTRQWLLDMLQKFGQDAVPAVIAMLPFLSKGDWKAAINVLMEIMHLPPMPMPTPVPDAE